MTTKAPAGFDPTVTTTIGMSGIRNRTAFSLGTNYAGATYNFVPNGSHGRELHRVPLHNSAIQCGFGAH